jgi:hypothetical protein
MSEDKNLVPLIQRSIYRCLDNVLQSTSMSPFESSDYVAIKAHQSPIVEKFLTHVGEHAKRECLRVTPTGVSTLLESKLQHALVFQLPLWMGLIATHHPPRSSSGTITGVMVSPTKRRKVQASNSTATTTNRTKKTLNPGYNNRSSEQGRLENARSKNYVAPSSENKDLPCTTRSPVGDSVSRATTKRRKHSAGDTDNVTQPKIPQPRFTSYDDLIEEASKSSSLRARDQTIRLPCVSSAEVAKQQEHNDEMGEYDCTYSDSEGEEETSGNGAPFLAVGRSSCDEDLLQAASASVRAEPIACDKPQIFTLLSDIRQQIRLCLQHAKQHNQKEFIRIKELNPSALQALFVDVAATLSIQNPSHSVEDVIDALSHRDDLWEPELDRLDERPDSAQSGSVRQPSKIKLPHLGAKEVAKHALNLLDKQENAPQVEGKISKAHGLQSIGRFFPLSGSILQTAFEHNESLYLPLLENLNHAVSVSEDTYDVQNALFEIITKLPDMTGPFIEAYGLIELVSLAERFDATFHATVREAIKEHLQKEQKKVPPGFKPKKLHPGKSVILASTFLNPNHARKDRGLEGTASRPTSKLVDSETTQGYKDPRSVDGDNSKHSAATPGTVPIIHRTSNDYIKAKAVSTLLTSELSDFKGLVTTGNGDNPQMSITEIDFRLDASLIAKWDAVPGVSVTPQPNDILIGHGNMCFNHPGNVRLRLVTTHVLDMIRQMKTRSAKSFLLNIWIINDVLRRNGRFLGKMGSYDTDWHLASYADARVKVGATVRDASHNKVKCIDLMKKKLDNAPKSSDDVPVLDKAKAMTDPRSLMKMDPEVFINTQMRGIIARRRAIEEMARSDSSVTGKIHTGKAAKVSQVPIEG